MWESRDQRHLGPFRLCWDRPASPGREREEVGIVGVEPLPTPLFYLGRLWSVLRSVQHCLSPGQSPALCWPQLPSVGDSCVYTVGAGPPQLYRSTASSR